MATLTNELGVEHARDAADCMTEGCRTLKKLKKSFPAQEAKLTEAEGHMRQAHALLGEVQQNLSSANSK